MEPQDVSLEATALREATEELGQLPPHSIRGSILTKYGLSRLLLFCSQLFRERACMQLYMRPTAGMWDGFFG